MDSQNYIINIFSLILCIFPNILYTQRITCPTPCDIGYTCAMVRHGTQPSAPGCISMQEAILLHQAINGGPSGPGSGINNQVGVGIQQQTPGFPQAPRPGDPIPPFPQGAGGTIPGMNFLGSTDPREPGFEQRFALGLGGQQRNFGFGPPGQVNGQFGRPQVPTGMSGPAFLDPTAGQFAGQAPGQFLGPSGGQFGPNAGQFGPNAGQFGPNAGQFGPNPGQFGGPPPGQFGPSAGQFGPGGPMGFNPQVDGGQNISSSASGIRDNTNIAWHDFSRGGGSFPRPGLSDNRAGSFQQITDAVDQTPIRIGQLGQLPRNFVERPGTFGTRQGRFGLQPRTDTFDPNSNQFGAAGIEIPSVGFNPQVVDLSIAPTPSVPHNRDMNNQISNDFSHVSHEGSHSQFDRSRQSTGGFGSMSSVPDQTAGQFDPQPHVDGDKSHISHGSDNNFPQRNSRFQACLNRNPWCPVGYVCQRLPTETPGQFEDSCVLQQRQRSSVRPSTMLSGLHNIGSGRRLPRTRPSSSNLPGSNSPSDHLDIPTINRNNPEPQIPLSWIPQVVQDNDIPSSGNVGRRTVTLDDIIREQSLEARDGIRPGLLKKNGVQRQPLTRNHAFQRTPVPSNRNQDNMLISTAASPFGVFNSTTTRRNDTTRLPINTQECKPCTNHADCNDIFTYCINKTPCTGKVCFKVT
ncbi:uncharacterized protein LOC132733981 isoform X2 [Ruditapes philippinarum]|uniref:uncharacterized protein LOC132733981 isoform X2 n=1 Tax=Ruditapes philippinarum TaxID=129788 RepID=UPI00295ABFB7|nr:uncharacterized protein LOC132733981 isoform X2 [Ruditapes philippinarum]